LASSDALGGFLDELAAATPAPGAGAVAAVTVALGAALVEMAAGLSGSWEGSGETLAAAHALRERVARLAQADADAYGEFLATHDDAARARIVAVPLEVAACAAEVASLAASLAEHGNPNLRGEALAAAHAASAGATIAARLVELNVGGQQDARHPDERLEQARRHASAARAAALAADPEPK
jgi:formiminotetrahydrofolate cyclodeaminase